jgi:hypothetical protein
MVAKHAPRDEPIVTAAEVTSICYTIGGCFMSPDILGKPGSLDYYSYSDID